MRRLLIVSSLFVLLAARVATAEDAFVIEAEKGQPDVGVRVTAETVIRIEAGGHLVLMTESGQVVRQDGPFESTGGSMLTDAGGGTPLHGGLIGSLLALAEASGTAKRQLGAVRGTPEEEASARPNAISSGVSVYCLTPGSWPEFYTSNAPAVDEPLIVRRRVRPKAFMTTPWPAGAHSVTWPSDWPAPKKGRYVWALGYRGTTGLKIVEFKQRISNPIQTAAAFYELGCESQARAAFADAVASAKRN